MKLFVGLGNPGEEYKKTRHNAGFKALDNFVRVAEQQQNFFLIGREKHAVYELVEFEWAHEDTREKIVCVWPQAYMNKSGEVVRHILRSHKKLVVAEDLIVLHDDVDIQIGSFKVDKNSSSGGHKGVQNIIDQLKTKDFIRFRIGIKPLRQLRLATEDFVLKKFSKEEEKTLGNVYGSVVRALVYFLEQGLQKTQNITNKKEK